MTITVFLNVIGLCLGFLSAVFFAIGALTMTPTIIQKVAATYWDANQHWGDSLAEQRADYIVGALLLFLAFMSQLIGALVPLTVEYSFLFPFGYAFFDIAAAITLILVCCVLLRNKIAKSTKLQVRKIQAAQEAEIAKPGTRITST